MLLLKNKINLFLIILLISISVIGVVLLYSIAGGNWEPWATKQVIRIGVGVIILITAIFLNIKFWYKNSYYFYLFSIFLILLTFVFGKKVSGATRWLDLYFLTIQPAEFARIFLILALSSYFHSIKLQSYDIKQRILFPSILLIVPVFLIFNQPDLGTALVVFSSGLIVFFISGIRIRTFVISGVIALLSFPMMWTFLQDYQKSRIMNFLDQQSNILGANYHITQSKIALGSGGFFGKGFLEGTQSHLNFIPEMQTDFIFSVLGEEFGFLGIIVLFLSYLLIILTCIYITLNSKNYFSKVFGISFIFSFTLSIFINIGMVTGLIPVVGVPLPLCSFGGSAMVSFFLGFGILLSGYNYRNVKVENI